ncbi:Immunoglobulin omega chain [Microtus ochrogaster]|nr:Immunoglobulin omega chain [Microtus ochrogaster]
MSVSAEFSGVCTMAWIPLLFFLLHCTATFSQPVLTQTPSASASLGASVKLTCTLSSEHSTYNIGWYQQQPEKAPKYLMRLYSNGNQNKGDGIPDRFSGSSSGAHRYLSISNIQPEDEAIYFCGAGSFSQPVLTQSPSASASLGASVKLTCTLNSEYSTYIIQWFQQQPEKDPKYLMWLKDNGNYGKGDGIPDRFSGSSSGAHRYLSISNIQPEDEAIYFCGADYSIGGQFG